MRRITLALVALVAAATLAPASAETVIDVRVTMDDGVTLKADVYIPTIPDGDHDGRYPCVVELTPYRKESRASEGASYLPGIGVALIEVDARGTGGSEGEYDIVFSVREQADAAAWVEWAASDNGVVLCEETVGMYGGSYSGIIQYLVASLPDVAEGDLPARPPHLAAIAPQRAYGDLYRDIVYHGGQVIGSFGLAWAGATQGLYTQPPTDHDLDAWTDHLTQNDPMMLTYLSNQWADARWTSDDSATPYSQALYDDSSILPRIENLRVPTLHLAGFYDSFTRGQLLTFARAHELETTLDDGRGPNFLIAGPWNHGGTHFITPDQGFKQMLGDWYLYFLEGRGHEDYEAPAWIADGLDGDGARVTYFQQRSTTVNPPASAYAAHGDWRTAKTWPLPGTTMERMYLADGSLTSEPPAGDGDMATWVHNPTAGTAEIASRWDNALAGAAYIQWDQRLETGKGLTYTTPELGGDLEIAGPLVLNLWASLTGAEGTPEAAASWPGALQATPPWLDGDLVVKVSDVAPDGRATLVTQGYLRASARAVDLARSTVLGGEIVSPFHPHTLAAFDPPASGELREYVIEVWPTAKTFAEGHRLRLDLTSADTPNHVNIQSPVTFTIVSDPDHPSYLAIPTAMGPH